MASFIFEIYILAYDGKYLFVSLYLINKYVDNYSSLQFAFIQFLKCETLA